MISKRIVILLLPAIVFLNVAIAIVVVSHLREDALLKRRNITLLTEQVVMIDLLQSKLSVIGKEDLKQHLQTRYPNAELKSAENGNALVLGAMVFEFDAKDHLNAIQGLSNTHSVPQVAQ